MWNKLLPKNIQENYEIHEWKHATAILTNDFPEEFIETLEWERIMHLAKEVLKAFGYQKNE